MPNGESRNWIRFLLTLQSFNILYRTWPTQVCLYPFLASDEAGNTFDYSREKSPAGEPAMKAIEWLGINKTS